MTTRRSRLLALAAALFLPFAVTASAAEPDTVPVPEAVETREIVFDLGIGAQVQPKFPTSDEYEVVPYPLIRLRFLRLPVIGDVVTGREKAFSIYPSFGFNGERSSTAAPYLAGLPDVDFAVELGGGMSYRVGNFRIFAELRRGVSGHDGFVGEAGVDAIISPFERLEFRAGPRIGFADDEYMDTYFGVDTATAFLPAYSPGSGIKDVGLAAEATYRLTERVLLHGRAGFTTYVGDAADSPITERGNTSEGTVGVGITYRFGFDFF